jgi:hypothetical protein
VLVSERVLLNYGSLERPDRSVGLNLRSEGVQGVGSDLTKARHPEIL